jgi:hypothetical protein
MQSVPQSQLPSLQQSPQRSRLLPRLPRPPSQIRITVEAATIADKRDQQESYCFNHSFHSKNFHAWSRTMAPAVQHSLVKQLSSNDYTQ